MEGKIRKIIEKKDEETRRTDGEIGQFIYTIFFSVSYHEVLFALGQLLEKKEPHLLDPEKRSLFAS